MMISCQNYYKDNHCDEVKDSLQGEDKKLIMSCSPKDLCLDEGNPNFLSCSVDGIKMEFEVPTLALNYASTLNT